jgi:hypothetical protein
VKRAPAGRLAAVTAAVVVLACTDLPSDPDTPFAIEVVPPVLPSVVRGDTLRDTLGAAAPLEVHVLNSSNDVIASAPVTFVKIDTASRLTIDPQSGIIVGVDTGTVRVAATVGSLQSAPLEIVVTLRPDTLTALSSLLDSMQFLVGRDTRLDLRVRVGHDTTPGGVSDETVPVRSYPVRFEIVEPAGLPPGDTTLVTLVNDAGRPSRVDTTDAAGEAKRTVRISPAVLTVPPDSIIVEARAVRPDRTPVPGSPVRFVVRIKP